MAEDGKAVARALALSDVYGAVLPAELLIALDVVITERLRQIYTKGFAPLIDDLGIPGRLAIAGGCYSHVAGIEMWCAHHNGVQLDEVWEGVPPPQPKSWPQFVGDWKPKGPRLNLIRAAALCLAELERMQRARLDQPRAESKVFSTVNTGEE